RRREALPEEIHRVTMAKRRSMNHDNNARQLTSPRNAQASTPRERVAEFLAGTGKLEDRDLHDTLELDDIDAAAYRQCLTEMEEAVRGLDDPGEALNEIWRTVLGQISRRAAQVNRAGRQDR